MLLTDDDRNCIDMDSMGFDMAHEKRTICLPLRPIICRFFIPKIIKYKSSAHDDILKVNNELFYSGRSQMEKSMDFMQKLFVPILKQESVIKTELEDSLPIMMPRISGVCSISTKSMSDCDYNDQLSLNNYGHNNTGHQSPVVKDVYSLTSTHRQPLLVDTDESAFITRSNDNDANRCVPGSDAADTATIRCIGNIIRLVKQNRDYKLRESRCSIDSGSETDEMKEGGDWVVARCWRPTDDRMQPVVLVERLPLDRIAGRKRKRPLADSNHRSRLCDSRASKHKRVKTEFPPTSPPVAAPLPSRTRTHDERNGAVKCLECSRRFPCSTHPIRWIVNEDVSCPFVEYVTTGATRNRRPCLCNRNELEHIQMGLPKQFQLKESSHFEIGIWTRARLARGTIIGPYLGEIVTGNGGPGDKYSPYKTRRLAKTGMLETAADAGDNGATVDELPLLQYAFKSNWLRCINFAGDDSQANMRVLRDRGCIFYQTVRVIDADRELFVCNKLQFGLIKVKNEPVPKSAVADRLASADVSASIGVSDHLTVPIKPLTVVRFTDGVSDKAAYSGIKCEKEVAMAKTKVRDRYKPEVSDIPQVGVAQLSGKIKSCPHDDSHTKFDNEMIAYLSELLHESPIMKSPQINQQIRKKFPNTLQLNDDCISAIIRQHKLRPLKGIDKNVDRDTVEAIVEMFIDRPNLTLEKCQRILTRRFPMKPLLDIGTIDSIAQLNKCRLLKTTAVKTNYRIDDELAAKIKDLITDQKTISRQSIVEQLKICFPAKSPCITVKYVTFVSRKLRLRPRPPKLDSTMKSLIYQLHRNNPTYSAVKINEQLRSLLPDKPCVSRHTVSKVIRHCN